jgi:hypothetical protein
VVKKFALSKILLQRYLSKKKNFIVVSGAKFLPLKKKVKKRLLLSKFFTEFKSHLQIQVEM